MKRIRIILLVDSLGALATGLPILLLHDFVAQWYRWSTEHVLFVAAGHLTYGLYSGILAVGFIKKSWLASGPVTFLVIANAVWAGQCFARLWMLRDSSSWLGLAAIALEGIYLVVLALIEARFLIPAAASERQ